MQRVFSAVAARSPSEGLASVEVLFHSEELVPFPLGGSKHPRL